MIEKLSKLDIFYNFYALSVVILAFVFYVCINILLSKMSLFGVFINLIGLIVLFYTFARRDLSLLIFFIIINILLGPFFFMNLSFLDMPFIGRLDYCFFNLLFFYLISKNGKLPKLYLVIILFLLVSFFYDCLMNGLELRKIDTLYKYISSMNTGLIMFLIWKNTYRFKQKIFLHLVVLILNLHLFLSILQLFYPIHLRKGTIESALDIFGIYFQRPLGLYEAAYIYAINTIFILFLLYRLVDSTQKIDGKSFYKFYSKFLLFLFAILSSISTRSFLVSVALSILFLFLNKVARSIKFLVIFSLLFILIIFSHKYYYLVLQEQSNSTKILLWFLTLKNFLFNSNIFQFLFGHGIDTAMKIANILPEFIKLHGLDARYDNRIDNAVDGFPIHNVYIQILYEHGVILFAIISFYLYRMVKIAISKHTDLLVRIFLLSVFFQYFFHNGMFSPIFSFALFLSNDLKRKLKN